MATLTGMSAVLVVGDLKRAVYYYRERLGFECQLHGQPANFATADRDGQRIMLAYAAEDSEEIMPNGEIVGNMWDVYIRVEGIDELYEEVQERGTQILAALEDAGNGFREFAVEDLDHYQIVFAEPL